MAKKEEKIIDIQIPANQIMTAREEMAKLRAENKELMKDYKANYSTIERNSAVIKNLTQEINQNTKQLQAQEKQVIKAEGAYKKLELEFAVTSQKAKDLSAAYGENDKRAVAMQRSANALNDRLKAIDHTVGQGQRTIGLYSDGIKNAANSFGMLPGPIGSAITSVQSLGRAMWAIVATPVGAALLAIVGAATALYTAFKSTDEGAVALEGSLKSLSNISDVAKGRLWSFFKMLGSFRWEDIKANARDAFGGIVNAFKSASDAGQVYARDMDRISDNEAAAAITTQKLSAEIETLKNKSKDQTKTHAERLKFAEQAMQKEVELNRMTKSFDEQRNVAETRNLASKIQGNGTLSQKIELLKKWVNVGADELELEISRDKRFADFVNKNEKEFQALQKSTANKFKLEADFQRETRRLQSSLSSEQKAMQDEDKANAAKTLEYKLQKADAWIIAEQNKARESVTNNEILQKRLAEIEMEGLRRKLDILGLEPIKQQQIVAQILDIRRKLHDEMVKQASMTVSSTDKMVKEHTLDMKTVLENAGKVLKGITDGINQEQQNTFDENAKRAKEQEDNLIKDQQNKIAIAQDFGAAIGGVLGETINGTEEAVRSSLKAVIMMALDALKAQMEMSIAGVTIQGLASLNPAMMAAALAKIVLIEAAFAAVKTVVSNALTSKPKTSSGGSQPVAANTTPRKFHDGNRIPGRGEVVITALGGETVINRNASDLFAPILEEMNMVGSGKKSVADIHLGRSIDYKMLTASLITAIKSLPPSQIAIKDITKATDKVNVLDKLSNYTVTK